MNSEGHYLVVISVVKCSDCHCNLPEISLPGSDQWRNYIEANEAAASVEIRLVGAWLDVA